MIQIERRRDLFVAESSGLVEVSHRFFANGRFVERKVEIEDFDNINELGDKAQVILDECVEPLCLELGAEACIGSVECHYDSQRHRIATVCAKCINQSCVMFHQVTEGVRVGFG